MASMDVIQAFDYVIPFTRSDTMQCFDINATMTAAILREQVGGTYDVYFLQTRSHKDFF